MLLRRTLAELTELIDKSKQVYPRAFPGAKFKESVKTWVFPSGATALFSYVDQDDDVYRYQGMAFSWIGIDELGHYPSPFVWNYLRSRLRTTDPEIETYMRATANPGGMGGWWIKKMFIDSRLFRLIIDETEKTLALIDFDICEAYSSLVENKTERENIFDMISTEYNLTKEVILNITGEEKLCQRFKKFSRKLNRRSPVLHQAGLEQIKLIKEFRQRNENGDNFDDLIPLLLSINCISSGLGWTG